MTRVINYPLSDDVTNTRVSDGKMRGGERPPRIRFVCPFGPSSRAGGPALILATSFGYTCLSGISYSALSFGALNRAFMSSDNAKFMFRSFGGIGFLNQVSNHLVASPEVCAFTMVSSTSFLNSASSLRIMQP